MPIGHAHVLLLGYFCICIIHFVQINDDNDGGGDADMGLLKANSDRN